MAVQIGRKCRWGVGHDAGGHPIRCNLLAGHHPATDHAHVEPEGDQPAADALADQAVDRLGRIALEARMVEAFHQLDNAMRRLAAIEAAMPFHHAPAPAMPPPIPRPLGPGAPDRLLSTSNTLTWGDACFAQRTFIVEALRAIPAGTHIPLNSGMRASEAAKIMTDWIVNLIESGDYPHA